MKPVEPIFTSHLFPLLDEKLLEILRSLSPQDWERQTIAPLWKVKDVAAHLLDGNMRALSMLRDHYFGEKPENIDTYPDLVWYLNRLNADWVNAMQRVSPKVLSELLEITGKEYSMLMNTLNPFEKALFSVAWAGESESENWFHIAREYTEKYHHQQQIRLAVGKEEVLLKKELYFPFLDTSLRALPHHYREVNAEVGDVIQVTISGESGGDWYLYRNEEKWILVTECELVPICHIRIPPEIAWRLFTKGISREEAEPLINIDGEKSYGSRIIDMLAVMA
ncbi:MAG: maleylpyruvate isomerase N-terminal domain-containing protein [Saprospiraceae bacterium]|nr:maleylpyruvate isomerase N-terminal domain-containing protein [Saprospiraceae bacterium]